MARNPAIAVTEVEEVMVGTPSPGPSAAGRATDWGAITGGALGAIAISILPLCFGLSTVKPWSFANRAPEPSPSEQRSAGGHAVLSPRRTPPR